jgi:hypothetical protein
MTVIQTRISTPNTVLQEKRQQQNKPHQNVKQSPHFEGTSTFQKTIAGMSILSSMIPGFALAQQPPLQTGPQSSPQIQLFTPNTLAESKSVEGQLVLKLLKQGGVSNNLAAVLVAHTSKNVTDNEKLSVLQDIFSRSDFGKAGGLDKMPAPAKPQAGRPQMQMMPGGPDEAGMAQMQAMQQLRALGHFSTELFKSIENHGAKLHWLTSPESTANFIPLMGPQGFSDALATLSEKTTENPETQKRLVRWSSELAKSDDIVKQTYAVLTAFSVNGNQTPLIRNAEARIAITAFAISKNDPQVRSQAQQVISNFLSGAKVTEAESTQTFNILAIPLWDKTQPASGQAFLKSITGLNGDTAKLNQLNALAKATELSASPAMATQLVDTLKTLSADGQKQAHGLLSEWAGGPKGGLRTLAKLTIANLSDHQDYGQTLQELLNHKNPEMAVLGTFALANVKDMALRKNLTEGLLNYGKDEMATMQAQLDAANQKHHDLENKIDDIHEAMEAKDITPEQKAKLEKEVESLMKDIDEALKPTGELDYKLGKFVDVVIVGINTLQDFKTTDPAFQTSMLERFLNHPQGRARLQAAKNIQFVANDQSKAALVRQATNVEGNAKFYITLPKDLQEKGKLPFVPQDGQTPFESIAGSASYAVPTINDDALKAELINELAHHPVQGAQLAALQSVASLKTGHEKVQNALIQLAEHPFRVMGETMPQRLENYPAEALKNLIPEMLKQGLEIKEDTQESLGWRNRVMGAKLMANLPATMDKDRAEFVKQGLKDRLEQVRGYSAMAALKIQDPQLRFELSRQLSRSEVAFEKSIALALTEGLDAKRDSFRGELYFSMSESGDKNLRFQAIQMATPWMMGQEMAKKGNSIPKDLQKLLDKKDPADTRAVIAGAINGPEASWKKELVFKALNQADAEGKTTALMMLHQAQGKNPLTLDIVKQLAKDEDAGVRMTTLKLVNLLEDPTLKNGLMQELMGQLKGQELSQAAMMLFGPRE